MKISLYSPSLKSRKSVSFDSFIEQLKTPVKSHNIEQLRIARPFSNGKLTAPYRDKIPFVGFSATFRTRNNADYLEQYNGVVLLEINRLKTQSEAEGLKEKIRSFPQVLLAFTGCSGLSLKFLVRFTLPDGSLPTDTQLVDLFHMQACRSALDYFRMQIDPRIVVRSDRTDIRCRFSFDPAPYINTRCVPILIEQPVQAPATETTWKTPLHERQDNSAKRKSGL
ncbi:MAG: BT4734/BF3469 family protein, partial [Bacteroidales bacterium]